MTVRKVQIYPNPILRQKSKPVAEINQEIQNLLTDLAETMLKYQGVGLAAIQVGVPLRCLTILDEEGTVEYYVNPEITLQGYLKRMMEGCLSVPDVFGEVARAPACTVKALDFNGKPFTKNAKGLQAQALQHEIEHLDGKMFTDYLTSSENGVIVSAMKALIAKNGGRRFY